MAATYTCSVLPPSIQFSPHCFSIQINLTKWWSDCTMTCQKSITQNRCKDEERKHGTPSTLPANKSLKIHPPRLVLVLPSWFQPAQSEPQSLLSTFLGSSLGTSTHSVLCKMHATSSKTVFLLQLPWEVDLARGNWESVDGPTWPCWHAFLHMGSYTCIVWPHCDALHPFMHHSVISQFLCLKCTCILT